MCEYKYFCENIFVQLLYKIKKNASRMIDLFQHILRNRNELQLQLLHKTIFTIITS